jgi:hypothetical protein
MKLLDTLDPEDVDYGYIRVASTKVGLPAPEISWDNGDTYTPLPATTDDDGNPAYLFAVSGPSANEPTGHVLKTGYNHVVVQQGDGAKRTTLRFVIYVPTV